MPRSINQGRFRPFRQKGRKDGDSARNGSRAATGNVKSASLPPDYSLTWSGDVARQRPKVIPVLLRIGWK